MKEKIYGWYPSLKDVYNDRIGVPTDYNVNLLYNFKGTMYQTKPALPGKDNLVILGHSQETPRSRPATATLRTPKVKQLYPQQRPKTAPVPKFKPIPKLRIPTPQECWSKPEDLGSLGEDATNYPPIHYNMTEGYVSPPPSTASTDISWPLPRDKQSTSQRRERVQSATIQRGKQTTPKRPVQSAGPTRPKMTPEATPIIIPSTKESTQPLPTRLPTPPVMDSRTQVLQLKDEKGNVVPDYEDQKAQHGWAVEVHGDPFKLKKMPRRLPYTIKLQEPIVAPEPPRIHIETNDTFFQNTIPRRPGAFSIHKDWVSEILHAKRMELQKREGIKYRWKNFGFVY